MKRLLAATLVLAALVAPAADSLTQTLQKGLFEEEANQNFPAAIQAYEAVISQADEQRKLTATALFRLGECYRKLGKTNEANAQFRRILRDFSEQDALVKASREWAGTVKSLSLSAPTLEARVAAENEAHEQITEARALAELKQTI